MKANRFQVVPWNEIRWGEGTVFVLGTKDKSIHGPFCSFHQAAHWIKTGKIVKKKRRTLRP
jgi:hypothetical protein